MRSHVLIPGVYRTAGTLGRRRGCPLSRAIFLRLGERVRASVWPCPTASRASPLAFSLLRLVQRQPRAPEQRIHRTLQRTDHRTDLPTLYQPATGARLSHAAGALQDVGVVLRAADRHHGSKFGELDRSDASGQGRRRAHA
jgi:hypothetical protein